jgi:O-antigen/teichoic acid export membrane protein
MSVEKSPIPELPRVVRGAGYNFLGAVSRGLLGFVVVFVLARILSAAEMGLFFLGLNILTFVVIIGIAGLDVGLRRFISIAHGHKDAAAAWSYFDTAVAIAVPINLVLVAALFMSAENLGKVIYEKPELSSIIRALTPFLIFNVAAELLLAVTQGYKHMKYRVLCLDVLNIAMRIVLTVLFAALGYTLYGAIAAYIISLLIASVAAFHYFSKVMPARPPGNPGYRFRSMAFFSLPTSLARLLNSGSGIVETIILGYFVVAEQVGIYTVAMKIAAIGSIVLASLNTVFAPLISEFYAQDRMSELRELYKAVTRWAFSLSLPVFMLMVWYSKPVAALFGQEYSAGAGAIVILCGGQLINTITGPSGNLLLMSGHSFTNLWTNLSGLVLTVVLSVVLIPKYGVVGCAAAVASAVATMNVMRVVLAGLFIRMHPYDIDYWKPIVAAALTLAILGMWGPDREAPGGVLGLLMGMGIGLVVYGVALFGLGLNQGDRYVLGKIRQRLARQ